MFTRCSLAVASLLTFLAMAPVMAQEKSPNSEVIAAKPSTVWIDVYEGFKIRITSEDLQKEGSKNFADNLVAGLRKKLTEEKVACKGEVSIGFTTRYKENKEKEIDKEKEQKKVLWYTLYDINVWSSGGAPFYQRFSTMLMKEADILQATISFIVAKTGSTPSE